MTKTLEDLRDNLRRALELAWPAGDSRPGEIMAEVDALIAKAQESQWSPIDAIPDEYWTGSEEFLGLFENGEQHVVYLSAGQCWRPMDGVWAMPTHWMPLPSTGTNIVD